jgi:hypothetical protein
VLADYTAADGRHLILATPSGKVRLWVRGPHLSGPHIVMIPADRHIVTRAAVALHFASHVSGLAVKCARSAFAPSAFQRHRLWLLRALLDAEQSGATRREMASHVLYRGSAPLAGALWTGSSERRRTHRMVRQARALAQRGYRTLLSGG